MDNRSEQQPKPPRREIPLKTWVSPFTNYSKLPYQYDRDDYKSKLVEFNTPGLGWWEAYTIWDQRHQLDQEDFETTHRVLIGLPNKEIIAPISQIIALQKQLEMPLVEITASARDLQKIDDPPNEYYAPYEMLMKLPSGLIIKHNLGYVFNHRGPNNEEYSQIFVPESSSMLGKVEMRVQEV